MRVFVTGASGFVGQAVVRELLAAGHTVLGFARSADAADIVQALGAQVHRGALDDIDSLRRGADQADGVIHTAFIHDFSRFAENCEIDRRAIAALGDALAGSPRPLVITSGTGLTANNASRPRDQLATETDAPTSAVPRVASEQAADALSARGVHVRVMRLPPSVHGAGDHGFVPMLIDFARRKGVSAYVSEGLNRWPSVHRHDAATLFRLALEQAAMPSQRYHAVAEEGVAFRDIATTIGRGLNLPVTSIPQAEAATHFEWFAHFAMLHNPSSSQWTREHLGWQPQQPTLLADMEASYFGA